MATTVPVQVARKRKDSDVRSEPPITVFPSASACMNDPALSVRIPALVALSDPLLEHADATTMSGIAAHSAKPPSRRPPLVIPASLAIAAPRRAACNASRDPINAGLQQLMDRARLAPAGVDLGRQVDDLGADAFGDWAAAVAVSPAPQALVHRVQRRVEPVAEQYAAPV